jgi:DnaJ family protein A protein 2
MRKGADLFMEKEITLLEALTGVDYIVTHLDGRKIRVKNTPGEVIKPDEVKAVEHMGMPFAKRTYTFGNLFIHFKIKFPTNVDSKSLTLISEALGDSAKGAVKAGRKKSEEAKKEDGAFDETCEMKAFEEKHRNTHHGGGTVGNDSDEEEEDHGHGGQRVGCQSQ